MQIIVLHGNDTIKSYERLTKFIVEAKNRGWKITDFSIEEITNQSLFDEECFYILKDYKLMTKDLIKKLEKYNGNLVIYNTSKIPAPTLETFNTTKVELFELPQILWKFLDNMSVNGLHELVKTQAIEYILAMMAWKFKQNYIKNSSDKNAKMILDLADIDFKSKIGKTDLLLSLDLLISKQLK